MRKTFKPIITIMTATCAVSFTLAACTTEPDESAAAPVDEATVVDADAAGVGIPNAEGDATNVTAVPGDSVYDGETESEGEAPSGAEPTNDIEADSMMPGSRATAGQAGS
jgi:hypothetical protein